MGKVPNQSIKDLSFSKIFYYYQSFSKIFYYYQSFSKT